MQLLYCIPFHGTSSFRGNVLILDETCNLDFSIIGFEVVFILHVENLSNLSLGIISINPKFLF